MKKVYLNGLNNIALIIDDERKKYVLCKETTARRVKSAFMYRVKLQRISEVLKAIKKDNYINIRG